MDFSHSVLSLDGMETFEPIRQLLEAARTAQPGAEALRSEILNLLPEELDPQLLPSWIAVSEDFQILVVHLNSPMFFAELRDADEFYEYESLELVNFVYCGSKKAIRYEDFDSEGVEFNLQDANVADVTNYAASEPVLDEICWFETPPATLRELDILCEAALSAGCGSGEIDAYELPAEETDAEEGLQESETSAEINTGLFLGDSRRTGSYTSSLPNSTPSLLWRSESSYSKGGEFGGQPVVGEGIVVTAGDSYTGACVASDLSTGDILWTTEFATGQSYPTASACIHDGIVYIGSNKGLHALDTRTGGQKWLSKINGMSNTSPLVVGDFCYVGNRKQLHAVQLKNGRKKWKFPFETEGFYCSPAYEDGILYFRGGNELIALEATKGKEVLWRCPASGYGMGGPALVGNMVVFTGERSRITAVDKRTGEVCWVHDADYNEGGLAGSGPFAVGNGVLTFRDNKGLLQALSIQNGTPLWTFAANEAPYNIGKAGPTVVGDAVLCVLVEEGVMSQRCELCAVHLQSGEELWRIGVIEDDEYLPEQPDWHCTPAVHNGVIFVQTHKGVLAFG